MWYDSLSLNAILNISSSGQDSQVGKLGLSLSSNVIKKLKTTVPGYEIDITQITDLTKVWSFFRNGGRCCIKLGFAIRASVPMPTGKRDRNFGHRFGYWKKVVIPKTIGQACCPAWEFPTTDRAPVIFSSKKNTYL